MIIHTTQVNYWKRGHSSLDKVECTAIDSLTQHKNAQHNYGDDDSEYEYAYAYDCVRSPDPVGRLEAQPRTELVSCWTSVGPGKTMGSVIGVRSQNQGKKRL
jgi:hypothetical protein